MKFTYSFIQTAVAFIFLTSTAQNNEHKNSTETNQAPHHWNYEETKNNEWAEYFPDCSGHQQSPINIQNDVVDHDLGDLTEGYKETPINVINNGHTVQFNYDRGNILKAFGKEYELVQFHFHTHSEHQINGKYFPMEVHLVHKNKENGQILVIGILFKEGKENPLLKDLVKYLPKYADVTSTSPAAFNIKNLFPAEQHFYTYSGSLTTPPCSEHVTWIVLKTPIEASKNQMKDFEQILHHNYRPIQATNERVIKEN
jgi:carbonic anhydrase